MRIIACLLLLGCGAKTTTAAVDAAPPGAPTTSTAGVVKDTCPPALGATGIPAALEKLAGDGPGDRWVNAVVFLQPDTVTELNLAPGRWLFWEAEAVDAASVAGRIEAATGHAAVKAPDRDRHVARWGDHLVTAEGPSLTYWCKVEGSGTFTLAEAGKLAPSLVPATLPAIATQVAGSQPLNGMRSLLSKARGEAELLVRGDGAWRDGLDGVLAAAGGAAEELRRADGQPTGVYKAPTWTAALTDNKDDGFTAVKLTWTP
jgi:hypothetical protein